MNKPGFLLLSALACASCTPSVNAGCSTNTDCADPTKPVCDPNTGQCGGCTRDVDCPPDAICLAGQCAMGCDARSGCPVGQQCDLPSHRCMACVDDHGCSGTTPRCDLKQHHCVPCLADGDCPAGKFCAPDQTCQLGCRSDQDCGGRKCLPDHSCSDCMADMDCAGGKVCDHGSCVAPCGQQNPCAGSDTCCANLCVDATSDPNNCGSCGIACAMGNACCGGACSDPAVDAANCGACGKACDQGQSCCNGGCVDLAGDAMNCGACGKACDQGQACCNGGCVDLAGDAMNCGACGNACGNGATCCGGQCVDTHADAANCGACGIACAQGSTCCNGACADLQNDANHCGACGSVCGGSGGCCGGACVQLNTLTDCGACGVHCQKGEFCDGKACQAPVYPNFCNNPLVWEIRDNIKSDDAGADVMASTITAICPMGVAVKVSTQTDAKLVDQKTGEPLAGGGVTYVLGGGPYANTVVKWLEGMEKVTRIYFALDGINYYWKRRADGSVAAQMAGASCSPHHDQFIIELVADPNNGTLSLIGYGACPGGLGSEAAAWHYAHVLLPNRANYPDSWYVFDYTDSNNDGTPNNGDTFKVLASGM